MLFLFLLVFPLVLLPEISTHKDTFCLKATNLTIIINFESFYTKSDDRWYLLDPTTFHPLVLLLLRDPCNEVWIYSLHRKRSIRLQEKNLALDLEREIVALKHIEISDFLGFTSQMPAANDTVEQSIIHLHDRMNYPHNQYDDLHDSKKISPALEELQNNKHYNIIALCAVNYFDGFCRILKSWIPKHRILNIGLQITNINVIKIIIDLVQNVNYKEMRYLGVLNRESLHHNTSY